MSKKKLYVHEENIKNKIKMKKNGLDGYKNLRVQLTEYYENVYLPFRQRIDALTFDESHPASFDIATDEFNRYYQSLLDFSHRYHITSQSKFESTFLEEISCYLFKDIQEIKDGTLDVFNKGIFAGLKIGSDHKITVITKDVDFCIGKKARISIDGQKSINLILPVVAVEVKTYLDATMFGEVKSSSKSIRSAAPNSKAYVLMGYKSLGDDHIIAARQDATLTEMFVLRKNEYSPMSASVIKEYWQEINSVIKSVALQEKISAPGRLLNP